MLQQVCMQVLNMGFSLGNTQYILLSTNLDGFSSHVGEKKKKIQKSEYFFLSDIFCRFCLINYRLNKIKFTLFGMSEEKIRKTLKCQFFFLIGDNFGFSEESWIKEYSECHFRIKKKSYYKLNNVHQSETPLCSLAVLITVM